MAGGAEGVHISFQMLSVVRAVRIVADGAVGARRLMHELLGSGLVYMAPAAKRGHPRFQELRLSARMWLVTGNARVLVDFKEGMLGRRFFVALLELGVAAFAEFTDGSGGKPDLPVLRVLMALLALVFCKRWVLVGGNEFRVVGSMGIVAGGAGRLLKRLAAVRGNQRLVFGIMAT